MGFRIYFPKWFLCVSLFMLPWKLVFTADDKPSYKIVSLLEICNNSKVQDESALSLHYAITYGFHENFKKDEKEMDFEYEKHEICGGKRELVNLLLTLIVDVSNEQVVNHTKKTRILVVFLYLPLEETILAANILSASPSVIVVSLKNISSQQSEYRNQIHNNKYLEYIDIPQETSQYLLHFLRRHFYDYIIVYSLNKNHGTHTRFEKFIEVAKKEICLSYVTTTVDDAVARTISTGNMKAYAFLIFGDLKSVMSYTDRIHKKHPQIDSTGSKIPLIYPIFQLEKEGRFHKIATQELLDILKNNGEQPRLEIVPGEYDKSYQLIHFEALFNKFKEKLIKKKNILEAFYDDNYAKRHGKSNCTNFKCKPGFERRLVNITGTRWNGSYTHVCLPCPLNHIKVNTSDEQCIPCMGKNISNLYKTNCYVPYTLQTFEFQAPGSIVGLTLNLIGLLFSFLVFVVYETHKKTPIVRASDRTLSQIQTISAFTMFLFLLVQNFLQANIRTCVLLPSLVGVTFTAFVAVTLAKVEKPILVFRDRKQLTQRDINRTIAQQYLMITLIPLASIMLAVIRYKISPVGIMTSFNDVTVKKRITCSTDGHLHIQIVLIIILSMFTLIQAYRARNLPDNYSESMTILYSSFSAAVFLGIFFPLYYSQESDQARMHVQWIILSSVGLILTLSMYARKIFIIVFQAEKNTMKAWNRKRLQYSMEAHESMSCISGPVINSEETFV